MLGSTPTSQVKMVHKAIDTYMSIVKKTACDMIPKAISLYIINELKNVVNNEMQIKILDKVDNYVSA